MSTAAEHYQRANAALARAGEWMDADTGWKGDLSTEERLRYRMADVAEAQAEATLAQVKALEKQYAALDRIGEYIGNLS
jgi:hypothetical protein